MTYEEAYDVAIRRARELLAGGLPADQCEQGIEKVYNGFTTFGLPRPANRYGFELRCEVVRPSDPVLR